MSKVVSVNEYDYEEFRHLKILKRRGIKKKIRYYDCICAFDIETTLLKDIEQSFMYVWQFQIDDDVTIIGRTWDEFRLFYKTINEILVDGRILIFIHNLSYEWQWLKSIIPVDDVFAMDIRKILYFISGCMEFRCSYYLSNMSLDKFLKHVGTDYKKVEGFDYDKIRYPNTPLDDMEMEYIINDVKGLVDAIKIKMKKDGDDVYSIPRTSTGYVRRIFRTAIGGYIRWFKRWLPTLEILMMERRAYRGGNCHLNRFYHGMILKNLVCKDISSSYPFQLLRWKYPKEFVKADEKYFEIHLKHDKACLFDIEIWDLKLKNELYGCPYLTKDKTHNIVNGLFDNGRILSMDYGYTTMTEIDFMILSNQATFKYKIHNLHIASKMKLPKKFVETLLNMYIEKTKLKGGDAYEYGKYKNMINAVYGMTVQNPLKCQYKMEGNDIVEDLEQDAKKLHEEYLEHGWLPYHIGVYVSAYARAMLYSAIDSLPPEDFVYCDTDSVYYVGDHDDLFEQLNEKYCLESLSAVDNEGVRHYCGAFEHDKTIKRFVSLGAKKYCYEDDKGLHITTSGVNKVEGAKELKKIENYKEGFIFKKAGGTESIYNDDPPMKYIHQNGIDIEMVSNIAIMPSSYTLGIAREYRELLADLSTKHIQNYLHYDEYTIK